MHAASVNPGPGSNPHIVTIFPWFLLYVKTGFVFTPQINTKKYDSRPSTENIPVHGFQSFFECQSAILTYMELLLYLYSNTEVNFVPDLRLKKAPRRLQVQYVLASNHLGVL